MDRLRNKWKQVPVTIRKPIVLTVGLLLMIAAVLLSPLPGPGGIPIFLIAVAVLASEFEWAVRLRDKMLAWVHRAGQWVRSHKILGTILILISLSVVVFICYFAFTRFKSAP